MLWQMLFRVREYKLWEFEEDFGVELEKSTKKRLLQVPLPGWLMNLYAAKLYELSST